MPATRKPRCTDQRLHDHDWLRARYIDDKLTIAQIGELLGGAAKGTVTGALNRAGITRRGHGGRATIRYPQLRDPNYMVEQLVTNQLSIEALARHTGCDARTVREQTQLEPVSSTLAAAGWDQHANARAAQSTTGDTAVAAITDAELIAAVHHAGGCTTKQLTHHLGLSQDHSDAIRRRLATLVQGSHIATYGRHPITYRSAIHAAELARRIDERRNRR